MIHEDLSSGTKKETEEQKSAGAALFALRASIMRRFSKHEFSWLVPRRFNSFTRGHLAARQREEEVLCGKRSYLSMLFCSSTFIGLFPVD